MAAIGPSIGCGRRNLLERPFQHFWVVARADLAGSFTDALAALSVRENCFLGRHESSLRAEPLQPQGQQWLLSRYPKS